MDNTQHPVFIDTLQTVEAGIAAELILSRQKAASLPRQALFSNDTNAQVQEELTTKCFDLKTTLETLKKCISDQEERIRKKQRNKETLDQIITELLEKKTHQNEENTLPNGRRISDEMNNHLLDKNEELNAACRSLLESMFKQSGGIFETFLNMPETLTISSGQNEIAEMFIASGICTEDTPTATSKRNRVRTLRVVK